MRRLPPKVAISLAAAILPACAIHPRGEKEERQRVAEAGEPYAKRAEGPSLPASPGPEDYVRCALLGNAELEARYWEWKAALEQVPQEASFPNAAISFEHLVSGGAGSLWNRTTLGIGNDPMTHIPFPTKLTAAGRRALEAARAAGFRFEAAKLLLRQRVLWAYYEYALLAEELRIQEETLAILEILEAQAAARVRSGLAMREQLIRAQVDFELAKNELENLKARLPPAQAQLNALLGREAGEPLPLPEGLPPPRPFSLSDEEAIRLASERSPELAALARDVAAREEALSIARQEYLPDIGFSFDWMGSASRAIGAMLTVPMRLEAIRAAIEQARAGIRAAQAARTQYARDLAVSFLSNLSALRNAERQAAVFEGTILPRIRETIEIARASYAAGRAGFPQVLEAEKTLRDFRLLAAELRVEREKALAALEAYSVAALSPSGPSGSPLSSGRSAPREGIPHSK